MNAIPRLRECDVHSFQRVDLSAASQLAAKNSRARSSALGESLIEGVLDTRVRSEFDQPDLISFQPYATLLEFPSF
jgi:hypothetical protein